MTECSSNGSRNRKSREAGSSSRTRPGKGRVNDDGKTIPLAVKKGDRVLIGKYSGAEVTIDNVEHVIVREEEILAVLEK